MLKKIAMVALGAVTVSALAQTTTQQTTTTTTNPATGTSQTTTTTTTFSNGEGGWDQRFDTYHIGSTDVYSIPETDLYRILDHNCRDINSAQAMNLRQFLGRCSPGEESAVVRALVSNYKMASAVRDEVAMARYGGDTTYTWLTYPPLTWSDTPGQNSWSTLNFGNGTTTTTTVVVTTPPDDAITMTEDNSRPMRMLMSRRGDRNGIDYDRAVDVLCSGVNSWDGATIRSLFHPVVENSLNSAANYTNEAGLDACIALIRNNSMMVHYLNRFSWYNHFDPNYYTSGRSQWGN